MAGPIAAMLPDGRRLHLQHGPIDLILEAFGAPAEVAAAYRQAWACFQDVLDTLVGELAALRSPVGGDKPALRGPVTRRMLDAVWPHRDVFVTPMAAVAGAVADHVLQALVAGRRLDRAYVNDGGDIALYLRPGHSLAAGIVTEVADPALDGAVLIDAGSPIRGIATSGWGGRSFSRGIADAVTVFAESGAAADAAATLVANAIDVDSPEIRRQPACALDPDSDLGALPVTVAVGRLAPNEVRRALLAGHAEAERMRAAGLLEAAVLVLRRRTAVVGDLPALQGPLFDGSRPVAEIADLRRGSASRGRSAA